MNRSLIWALTSVAPETLGSCTKALPDELPGGKAPVVPNFKHSMTVVFPQPFAPTIMVRGDSNSMACSRSGLKARMPRMASFSIWDMVALRWFCLNGSAGCLTAVARAAVCCPGSA